VLGLFEPLFDLITDLNGFLGFFSGSEAAEDAYSLS
jgi:hypothetical protein